LQNILIVCSDKELRKDLSKSLASELKFLYVDVDEVLDFEMLNNSQVNLTQANEVMKMLERKSINRVLGFKDCIVTMSRDLFVSNNNFALMKDYFKVFISLSKSYFIAKNSKDMYKLEQELLMMDKINQLVGLNCHITIEKNIQSVQQLSYEIINQLKKA